MLCPAVVEPRLKVFVHAVGESQSAEDDELPVPKLLLFSSINVTPSRKVTSDAAVPLKVTMTLFIATAPALSAVKVKVARLSVAVFTLLEAVPRRVAPKESLERSTAIALPVADVSVAVEVTFEVFPYATTISAVSSNVVSAVDDEPAVVILKICVALSVAPLEL